MVLARRPTHTSHALLAIIGLALLARLLVLPFATADGGDSVYRTWGALRWLSDPEVITHGIWGPLHYYLISASLALVPDLLYSPVAVHVGFGLVAPCLIYLFTKEEFGSSRSALLVAALYARSSFERAAIRSRYHRRQRSRAATARREGHAWFQRF